MVSASLLATATALLALSSAAPTSTNGFSVQQVPLNRDWRLNGVQKTAQVYRKFKGQMPAELAAAAALQTGTVVATPSNQYDDEYTCQVSVGGQTLPLDFDTGSADLWVFSSLQPASQRSGHKYYTPGSTAHRLSGYNWDISYGDGSGANGVVYTDMVNVGGATVSSQAVEAATSVSFTFVSDTTSDGLVGLAFSSINTVSPVQQKTFFDNVKPSLPSPLFTANLKYHAPGRYDFGYIDSSQHTGSITYVPVNTAHGFWEFTSNGYAVGSGRFVSTSINAIADTGTTLLYLPASIAGAYWSKVSGAQNSNSYGGYVFPCSATLPSITLGIGSYRAVVPGQYINYAPVQTGSSTCYGGIQPNAGISFAIYGDIFLKSQFVVFDGTSPPQLGFAPKSS